MSTSAQRTARSVSRGRRRWLPTMLGLGLLGVGTLLYLFLFVAVPIGEGPTEVEESHFVGYFEQEGDDQRLLQEQAVLLDSKPLFMPTRWNVASSLQNIARLRDEAELFARYEPVVRLGPGRGIPDIEALSSATTSVEALLRRHPAYPLRGFGQTEDPEAHAPLPDRVAAISVENLSGGPAPAGFPLSGLPEMEPPGRLWNPAAFMLVIDPRTSGGRPLRVASSGNVEWDMALARHLASEAFRQRLAPGYYRVTVGP